MSEDSRVYERCGLTFKCLQEELMVSLELLKALLVLHGGDLERQGQHSGHREECDGVPGRRSERREASGARADHNSTWGLSSNSKVQSAFVGLFGHRKKVARNNFQPGLKLSRAREIYHKHINVSKCKQSEQ